MSLSVEISNLMEAGLFSSAAVLCDFLVSTKPEGQSYYTYGEALMGAKEFLRAFQYFKVGPLLFFVCVFCLQRYDLSKCCSAH